VAVVLGIEIHPPKLKLVADHARERIVRGNYAVELDLVLLLEEMGKTVL
jgi:hypothetical protein